jgi:hypothetical protein
VVSIVYQVRVGPNGASGAQYRISTTVNGAQGPVVTVTVTTTPPGPGEIGLAFSPVMAQKSGSVLIYNIYTSGTSTSSNDTRIVMTNANQVLRSLCHSLLRRRGELRGGRFNG